MEAPGGHVEADFLVVLLVEDGCLLHRQGSLMMEAVRASETSVNLYQFTRRYNQEDSHLHVHRQENLKSYYFISTLD
jgi:hypothetical protein